EGHMLEHPDAGAEHLSFARSQVLQASGATGPAAIGVMHWQAAHIAQPMRAWAEGDRLGPLGSAAAAAAWALTLILDSFSVTDPDDPRAANLLDTLAEAGEQLAAASTHLHRMSDQAIDLASELAAVMAAASDGIGAAGNGHPPTHD
ncbi:MAG: hypothetical protein M3295_10395, partial [Chloroflexota bacterium]|nr:hypothetical protein [Chloroflexota bacterium]